MYLASSLGLRCFPKLGAKQTGSLSLAPLRGAVSQEAILSSAGPAGFFFGS